MSIADKLTQLNSIRTSIRTALATKLSYDVSDHDYSDFATDIAAIVQGGGGTDVSDTTATADKVLESEIFYASDGTRTVGTMPNKGEKTVTVTGIGTSGLKINGYVTTIKGTIDSDSRANLVADNVKKDITILGVTGTYTGESGNFASGVIENIGQSAHQTITFDFVPEIIHYDIVNTSNGGSGGIYRPNADSGYQIVGISRVACPSNGNGRISAISDDKKSYTIYIPGTGFPFKLYYCAY